MYAVYANDLSKCKTITPSLFVYVEITSNACRGYIVQSQCVAGVIVPAECH